MCARIRTRLSALALHPLALPPRYLEVTDTSRGAGTRRRDNSSHSKVTSLSLSAFLVRARLVVCTRRPGEDLPRRGVFFGRLTENQTSRGEGVRNPVDVASGTTERRRSRPCPCSLAWLQSRYVYRADIEPHHAKRFSRRSVEATRKRSRPTRRVSAGAKRQDQERKSHCYQCTAVLLP